MECPDECPTDVYKLMSKCWEWDPNIRPTFKQIYSELENMFQESVNNSASPLSDDLVNKKLLFTNYYNPSTDSSDAITNGNSLRNNANQNNTVKVIITDQQVKQQQQQIKNQPVLSSFISSTKISNNNNNNKNILPPKPPERSCSFKDNENLQQQCANNSQQLARKEIELKQESEVNTTTSLNNFLVKSLNNKFNTLQKQKETIQDNIPNSIAFSDILQQNNQLSVSSNEFQRVISNLKKVNKTVENANINGTDDVNHKSSTKKVFPKTQLTTISNEQNK